MASVATLRARLECSLPEHLSSTLLLREGGVPPTVSTGVAALDSLTGGLPRGALSEITGLASSGRTAVMLASLAGATHREEVCALIDASDSFDPISAAAAGVNLDRLLWVRCNETPQGNFGACTLPARLTPGTPAGKSFAFSSVLEQMLKATDLLLQSGGFGMVVLDLGDIQTESVRRVPLTSWFRFRRAVEPTATVLLLVENEPCAKTCASLVVRLQCKALLASDTTHIPAHGNHRVLAGGETEVPENNVIGHAGLLRGMRLYAEVIRSTIPLHKKPPHHGDTGSSILSSANGKFAQNHDLTQCKPVRSIDINFDLRATW